MVRSRVDITMNFGAITSAVDRLARDAVSAGAIEGARVAGSIAAQRKKTGLMSHMQVLPVRGTPDGWEASFRSPAWYRLFQDLGTEEARTTKLSAATIARRSSPSGAARRAKREGHGGIEGLHFYRAGRRAGRAAMMAKIASGIR